MRKAFKVILLIILIIIALTGVLALYIALRGLPEYPVQKISLTVDVTPQRVERGTKLASMLCRSCHYNSGTQKFTGRELKEVPQFGTIYSKNITQDKIAGIGSWTDGELIHFIRTGINRNGKYIPPYMPKLKNISDEDLYSLIAFLRSENHWVQPDNTRQPDTKPSFLTKFLLTIGAFKPFPYPTQVIPPPDTSNKVAWGKYISCYQLECFACHSKDFAKNDYGNPEKSPGFFGGGNKMYTEEGKEIFTLNITMDEKTGIGSWSEEDFVKAVKTGQIPNGQPALRYPMIPYTNLTDDEAKAIFAYLKTVPVKENKVDRKLEE
jgi:cytochrome c2/mono/diheme cytochrome c family protein